MPCSGKSVAAAALKSKGFTVIKMSDSVRELMKKEHAGAKGIDQFAIEKRKQSGSDVFAKLVAKKIPKRHARVAINGVRGIEEIRYFKKESNSDILVVAITSPVKLRYKRSLRTKGTHNYREFLSHDRYNTSLGVGKLMRGADVIIANTGKISTLKSDINKMLKIVESGALSRRA